MPLPLGSVAFHNSMVRLQPLLKIFYALVVGLEKTSVALSLKYSLLRVLESVIEVARENYSPKPYKL